MARWIAFDQKTTSILRSTLKQGTRIDTLLRGPVDYALARPSAVIAVLPAGGGDRLGIATFRRARAAVTQRAATEQLRSIPRLNLPLTVHRHVLADFLASATSRCLKMKRHRRKKAGGRSSGMNDIS